MSGSKQKPDTAVSADHVFVPANNDDIDGIRDYILWHMCKAGLSSNVLHYFEVLVEKAKKNSK